MNFYHADALKKHPSIITGESTPSYLLHRCSSILSSLIIPSNIVIPRIKKVLPSSALRLLVMLRNPALRAYSQYQMAIDMTGTPEQMKTRGMSSYADQTFEDIIEREIKQCEDAGLHVSCHCHFDLTEISLKLVLNFLSRRCFNHSQ
jgi:hypothetical protein